jgi:glycosyltransferase involved in cell wall biosynthesis
MVTDSYKPNVDGVSVFLDRLTKQLASKGHEVGVVAPSFDHRSFTEVDGDVVIFRQGAIKPLKTKAWFFSPFPYVGVYFTIKKFSPDVVHINLPFSVGLSALRVARRQKIPVVATCHTVPGNISANFKFMGPTINTVNAFLWQYFRWFYNQSDFVTAPTPTAVKMLNVKNCITRPIKAISNGLDTESFRPGQDGRRLRQKLKVPKGLVVLYTGRLDKEKELEIWVRAIPLVLKEIKAHFVIAGEGTEKNNLKKLTKKLGVSKNVTFTGFLKDEEFPLIYNLASVFAISSPVELQSIVVLEAMASGLPVVGVKAGALPELIKNEENGFLFPPNDFSKMAEAIVRVLKDKRLLARFGKRSREIVLREHSLEVTANKYLEVYQEVLK